MMLRQQRALFAEWSEKYERIEYEIKRLEVRLDSLERREKMLKIDLWLLLVRMILVMPFLYLLATLIPDIPRL